MSGNFVDQKLEIARDITVAILNNSKEISYSADELERTGSVVSKLFLNIHNAVLEASQRHNI